MTDIINELKKLEKEVEEGKSQKSMLEGRISSDMERLSSEFEVDTLDKAKAELVELVTQKEAIGTKIQSQFDEIKEQFEW